jgi:TolB-like protein
MGMEEQKPNGDPGDLPRTVVTSTKRVSFLRELSRREVFQTAGIYAGGAWLLAEILLAVLDRSPFPESVRALAGCVIISVFIAGFPIAVLLAWFFDLTRRGVTREHTLVRPKLTTAIAAMTLLVAVTGAIMWKVNPCGLGRVMGIAVLPCSFYGAADYDHEGSGLAEELNYRLSHVPQLRVPAWPSVSYLAKTIVDPSDLSSALDVGRLVECGMRRSEARVSINLQLYDPGADRNIWADEYEGQASDQLLLIAEAYRDLIGVDALNVGARAGGRIERINKFPTASAEAWFLFQRARHAENMGDHEAALSFHRQAASLDPDFARAHTSIARLLWRSTTVPDLPNTAVRAGLDAAWAHTQRALGLQPKLSEGLAMRRVLLAAGMKDSTGNKDLELAVDPEALHAQIIRLRPSFAEEYLWWAIWLESQGRHDEALSALTVAGRLDPSGRLANRQAITPENEEAVLDSESLSE